MNPRNDVGGALMPAWRANRNDSLMDLRVD